MFNTRTFFGTDGTLTVANVNAVDEETLTLYFGEGNVVGRVTNVTLAVSTDVKAFHELGYRLPREMRAGNIDIRGSVERAYVNGALLRLMLGDYALNEEGASFVVPSFNMLLTLDNQQPAGNEGNSVLTIYGVMFDSLQLEIPAGDFAMEGARFKAMRAAVLDTEVPT